MSHEQSGRRKPRTKLTVGWREWIRLPAFEIPAIKAKIDTGARTSSLHAFDIRPENRSGEETVSFEIHPDQHRSRPAFRVSAPVHEWRKIRSSSGHAEVRPVILVQLQLMEQCWEVELTLTRRDEMGFRMLIGRQALRGLFVIDPGRSFIGGRPG